MEIFRVFFKDNISYIGSARALALFTVKIDERYLLGLSTCT